MFLELLLSSPSWSSRRGMEHPAPLMSLEVAAFASLRCASAAFDYAHACQGFRPVLPGSQYSTICCCTAVKLVLPRP